MNRNTARPRKRPISGFETREHALFGPRLPHDTKAPSLPHLALPATTLTAAPKGQQLIVAERARRLLITKVPRAGVSRPADTTTATTNEVGALAGAGLRLDAAAF